jgi:hypothetical protein
MDLGAAIAIGAVVGVVCGLAPLIYGLNKNEKGLGWGGFGVCVASGMLLGALLALPMAILFSILIHNAAKRKAGAFGPQGQTQQAFGQQGYAAPEAPQATGSQPTPAAR